MGLNSGSEVARASVVRASVGFESREHLAKISRSANQHDESDQGERAAGQNKTGDPKVEPIFHQAPARGNYIAIGRAAREFVFRV